LADISYIKQCQTKNIGDLISADEIIDELIIGIFGDEKDFDLNNYEGYLTLVEMKTRKIIDTIHRGDFILFLGYNETKTENGDLWLFKNKVGYIVG